MLHSIEFLDYQRQNHRGIVEVVNDKLNCEFC
ncbi:hypothetical protein AAEX37_01724 [Oligella sp. MSHR50489EDL]